MMEGNLLHSKCHNV